MYRSYLSIGASQVPNFSDDHLFGQLAQKYPFTLESRQRVAWQFQIKHLRVLAAEIPAAHFLMEFLIPRMGRRVDLVIISSGIIFVVEYKVGARNFDRSSLDQAYGYGLDLKHFHELSHTRHVVPILVATEAEAVGDVPVQWDLDNLARPLKALPAQLSTVVNRISAMLNSPILDPLVWLGGRYHPTPTIVEAAQALYRGHEVEEISRSEAGAKNLTRTSSIIEQIIDTAKATRSKVICFITGVPGSGKTLAGLNLATSRQRAHTDEHAVFLSGNGPLVEVLREALALDAIDRMHEVNEPNSKKDEDRRAGKFIQNIHHFRDDALANQAAPIEKVAIFDEAQRAWDAAQTSKFMQQKKGQIGFRKSEPEFLLGVMDRHEDWCAIVCLVGSGQEINIGEAGIEEWLRALSRSYPHWHVFLPRTFSFPCSIKNVVLPPDLHLSTSIRSFRAERLSDFVNQVIEGDAASAASIKNELPDYPLLITQDLDEARQWLRRKRRGYERAGLLASSNAVRLKPCGIFVKAGIEPRKWFLAPHEDIRSSDALEDAGTEFDVQGLELDWACLCWDANFRRNSKWESWRFKGSKWQAVNDIQRRSYLANSYRVLLTRARQGLVVFVPRGSHDDLTRHPTFYQETYEFLKDCGFVSL